MPAQTTAHQPVRDPEDAHRLFAQYFNSGDIDGLLSLYASDAILMSNDGQPVKGHAAIREGLGDFLASKPQIKLTTTYAITAGDIALLRCEWVITGTAPDGSPIRDAHSSTEVLRRQPDGTWLYAVDHPFGSDSADASALSPAA